MKKLLFIVALISLTRFANAQTYPLVDTNKLWSNLIQSNGEPPPVSSETYIIKFNGDTSIGLYSYNKVFQSNDSTQSSWTEIGFIREDSSQKVYYYRTWDTIERLLYNFAAGVGDTVSIMGIGNYYVTNVVDSIDSVFVFDKYRKRLWFGNNEQWIDGIGSICGVLASGSYIITGGINRLLCYYENDTLKYINSDYNLCYLSTVGLNKYSSDNISVSIYPNPATNNITIECLQKSTMEILNIQGQTIMQQKIQQGKTDIDISALAKGVYILRLCGNDKTAVSRIVKV